MKFEEEVKKRFEIQELFNYMVWCVICQIFFGLLAVIIANSSLLFIEGDVVKGVMLMVFSVVCATLMVVLQIIGIVITFKAIRKERELKKNAR